jgi:hypothetical protein
MQPCHPSYTEAQRQRGRIRQTQATKSENQLKKFNCAFLKKLFFGLSSKI